MINSSVKSSGVKTHGNGHACFDAAEASVAAVKGRCGKRPHGEIWQVQLAVSVFFFSKIGKQVSFGMFIVEIIPHSFCSFFFGWQRFLPPMRPRSVWRSAKKTGVASSIVWSLAGQRTLVFFSAWCLLVKHMAINRKETGKEPLYIVWLLQICLCFKNMIKPKKNYRYHIVNYE